jgi:hypothetical protein
MNSPGILSTYKAKKKNLLLPANHCQAQKIKEHGNRPPPDHHLSSQSNSSRLRNRGSNVDDAQNRQARIMLKEMTKANY